MEYTKLLWQRAWSFHRTTGLDVHDLFQEASYAYLQALKTYDVKRNSKITTYIYTCVTRHLLNYIKLERAHNGVLTDLAEITGKPVYQSHVRDVLTPDANVIADLVTATPMQFVVRTRGDALQRIQNIMIQRKGWNAARVQRAFYDLWAALSD